MCGCNGDAYGQLVKYGKLFHTPRIANYYYTRCTYIHQGRKPSTTHVQQERIYTEFPLDPVSDLRECDGPLPQPRLSHQFQSGCGQEAIPTHTCATGENIHKILYSLMYIWACDRTAQLYYTCTCICTCI